MIQKATPSKYKTPNKYKTHRNKQPNATPDENQ